MTSQASASGPSTELGTNIPPDKPRDAALAKQCDQPDREKLIDYVSHLQYIQRAQSAASTLREKAEQASDPGERERILREAIAKDTEAHGLSKTVRRMQSGTWQGLAGGVGIGAAVSAGVGGMVGTLATGVLAVPVVGLGALIGSGVGAIRGPFITIDGLRKRWFDASPEEVVDAMERDEIEEDDGTSQETIGEEGAFVRRSGDGVSQAPAGLREERKRPRKLEIRSGPRMEQEKRSDG